MSKCIVCGSTVGCGSCGYSYQQKDNSDALKAVEITTITILKSHNTFPFPHQDIPREQNTIDSALRSINIALASCDFIGTDVERAKRYHLTKAKKILENIETLCE